MGRRVARGALAALALVALSLGGYALAPEHVSQVRDAGAHAPGASSKQATASGDSEAVAFIAAPAPETRAPASVQPNTASIRCEAERRRAIHRWLARPTDTATPDAAITRALMRTFADRSTDQFAFNALLHQWPLDADVAWAAWEHCLPTQACNRALRARHLVKVDGRNGVAWLALMDRLARLQDRAGMEHALARAAAAPEFNMRRGSTYVRVYPVYAALTPSQSCWQQFEPMLEELTGTTPTLLDMADLEAHGAEIAATTPGAALSEACGDREGHRLARSRRKDCIAVLTRLSDQPTLGDQMMGLRLLVPLLDDDGDALRRREQYRQVSWLLLNIGKLRFPPGSGARIWSEGEANYFKAQLREQGLWPPPPDWLPPDERSRRLIRGGG